MSETPFQHKRVALLGNPNTGKTTLFNALTGMNQRTGNFPGCTVERKTGFSQLPGSIVQIIDLPGTYSLAALSPDELVVAETLLNLRKDEQPIDAVLVVVDAACLHRNLYLVHQLRELGLPTILSLNMIDLATKKGIHVDAEALEQRLGMPVVPTNAGSGLGMDLLKSKLEMLLNHPFTPKFEDLFPEIRSQAKTLTHALNAPQGLLVNLEHIIFRALIDEEGSAARRLQIWGDAQFPKQLETVRSALESKLGRLIELETQTRYRWVKESLDSVLQLPTTQVQTFSDRLDKFLTHPILGLGFLLALLAVIFQSIYGWAVPIMDQIESFSGFLGQWAGTGITNDMLRSLVVDGIIGGAGGVLVFLPQIIFLFAFLAILEDCGYMARAAFLMDRIFKSLGLSGKSLIPLLSSFACAVPGLMATRTIEDRRDRFTTILVAPFMSCSARLPVYAIMIAAFIPARKVFGPFGLQGLTLLAMYSVGILIAIPTAWLLKRTMLRGVSQPFLMELPSFKVPNLRTVGIRVYQAGREFMLRAGTTILAVSILVWALAYFPRSEVITQKYAAEREQLEATILAEKTAIVQTYVPTQSGDLDQALNALFENPQTTELVTQAQENWDQQAASIDQAENGDMLRSSFMGRMGHFCEPIVVPLGWDWRIGMAALASFPAREIVVATLGVIFNLGSDQNEASEELRQTLRAATRTDGTPLFTVPVALSIMVFFALCAQCAATLAVMKKETGKWRYPIMSFSYMTGVAYIASFLVFQTTTALGW